MSGHGGRAARQRWTEFRYISLTPPEALPIRAVCMPTKETACRWLCGRFTGGGGRP